MGKDLVGQIVAREHAEGSRLGAWFHVSGEKSILSVGRRLGHGGFCGF